MRLRLLLLLPVLALPVTLARAAVMNDDPEAQALRQRFLGWTVASTALRDDFDTPAERHITGPVTVQDGVASFPEDRSDALYLYYGTVLPRRGSFSLDFRLDRLPREHNFMTLCEAGTGGNTKFMIRLGLDRRVSVMVTTRRENIKLLSEPVTLGAWHKLRWWYAPEGSVLQIDGVIEDYSTDNCTPYAVEGGEAFYLGDQPWWDPGGRRVIFYPLDNFVGQLDNLALEALTAK